MKQRRSGHNETYDVFESPLGPLFLVISSSKLIGVMFSKPFHLPLRRTEAARCVKRQLTEYFEKKRMRFSCPVEFTEGTPFEVAVWRALEAIPYGETRTYKWMSEKTGQPRAFRAVGQALKKNPIPIIYPCHRVIESDGSLGGYSSGIDIKRRLLELEYYTGLARR